MFLLPSARRAARFIVALAAALLLAACGDDDTEPSPQGIAGDLTVFAASSLTDAFNDIEPAFTETNPRVSVSFNFGGSQQLVTQLAQGARADVLATANTAQMDAAIGEELIDGEPATFARNRLAVIVPSDNPGNISAPVDLARDGLKIVIANEDVPVGAYSRAALDSMSADPEYGDDFRQRVEANVVSLEENVRQVVAKVALGEADAGIVYATDVTGENRERVAIIAIPDEHNVSADYPIAAVAGGNADLARAFLAFVLSPEGQEILARHGFAGVE